MLHLVDRRNRHLHAALLRNMFRDRKRVFVDLMGWDLAHADDEERDAFDDDRAEYLILEGDQPGDHVASLRFLPTTEAHLLDTAFAWLCEGAVPRGAEVREITRLCLPFRRRLPERIAARNVMARAIVDYGLLTGITSYTAVCNMGFLSELLSAGWRCRPLGLPQPVAGELAGALQIFIDPNTLDLLSRNWRCDPAGSRVIAFDSIAA